VRDAGGGFLRVVERKDANPPEAAIREVNAGVYAFDRAFLAAALPRLSKENAQGEYYLTDVLALARTDGRAAVPVRAVDASELLGVNSRRELAAVDGIFRARAAAAAMDAGVTLIRPDTITLDDTVLLEADVVVEPFATLLGETRVAKGSRIGQGCVIRDSVLGAGVTVKPYTVMERSRVGDGAIVGPFSRLREGTELAENVHVGNFVETKKARLARGAKANHLTYLGDAVVGEGTNVGAGVITCNYDGFGKHQTTIGRDVFVGSDVQLVAPVSVGDGAVVGAGTTVTADVPPQALVTSRVPQQVVPDWAPSYRERKKRAKEE
jgi:bifunctional UDP-N-acetylglucosamine pyrophosphorylase/glucosamine-1-phosphate N-acetyltransferase